MFTESNAQQSIHSLNYIETYTSQSFCVQEFIFFFSLY